MGVNITYMGTKRVLAPIVCDVLNHSQPGTLLDAFSGMCAVGEAVGQTRYVWNNDIQVFASEVAKAMFTSKEVPLTPLSYGDAHFARFKAQTTLLSRYFPRALSLESNVQLAESFIDFEQKIATFRRALTKEIAQCNARTPHLFSTTYSGSYFGIKQAIDTDAIVTALRSARAKREVSTDQFRWGMIALGRTLLKIANSTGHFAQYLTPKEGSYQRFLRLRGRSVWEEWLSSLALLTPVGTPQWRRANKVFNLDALSLIPKLARRQAEVSVIYADPPYTDDQYSRFYHVLETLCLYDYPSTTGAGLYRTNRFRTPFSVKTEAAASLAKLIESSAKTGADLVLSYPAEGLAIKSGADVGRILRKHFRRVEVSKSLQHKHSTFGASKGPAHSCATEMIYLARS